MSFAEQIGWDRLRHGGLLLDPQRLKSLETFVPDELDGRTARELRRRASLLTDGSTESVEFVFHVVQNVCGFDFHGGSWQRGPQVPPEWGRRAITGEVTKPRMLWTGNDGGVLPVFYEPDKRVGIGRGRRTYSRVVQWLRKGDEKLALLTNGR